MRSPAPCRSSPRTTAAMSPAPSCSSTAGLRRSEFAGRHEVAPSSTARVALPTAPGLGCRMLTDRLPRVRLGHLPTPLHELPRLSRALGGPRLFVKRDDQTGLATGGNKTRKLEFSVAEALHRGADTLVTLGAVQSNHARQTAAAAAACGLRSVIVLRGHAPPVATGNLLLDHLLGARIVFSGERAHERVAGDVVAAETAAGHRPYLIPVGASDEIGAAGFVAALEERKGQLDELRLRVDRGGFASSPFATQAGLCVGATALGLG